MSEQTEDKKENKIENHHLLKSIKKDKKSFADIKVPEGMTGFVECVFLKDWGSKKEGDKEVYHSSTARALVHHGAVKVNKHIKKYVPKKAKE